jgi:hypothetical protein
LVDPIGRSSGAQYPSEPNLQVQLEKVLNAHQDQLEMAKNKTDWQAMATWILEGDSSTKGIVRNNPALVKSFLENKSESIFAEESGASAATTHKSIYAQAPPGTKAVMGANKTSNLASWEDYKKSFIQKWKENGVTYERVVQPDYPGETTSEGMGYALRMAVQNGDLATFDKLLAFVNKNLDSNGLMNWHVNETGPLSDGKGGATDADQDIAYALCQAAEKWGQSNPSYATAAKTMIEAIGAHEVNLNDPNCPLLSGDLGSRGFNPSYVDPMAWAAFAKMDSSTAAIWNKLIPLAITAVVNCAGTTGLVPDWSGKTGGGSTTNYGYDACRTPMRLAEYYKFLWDQGIRPGDPAHPEMQQIKDLLSKEVVFFASHKNQSGGIGDAYDINTGAYDADAKWSNPAFNAPIWLAAQILSDCGGEPPEAKGLAQSLRSLLDTQIPDNIKNQKNYFSSSIGILCDQVGGYFEPHE